MKKLWVGLVAVLVLVAIGAYFYFYRMRQAPPQHQQTQPSAPVAPPTPIVPPPAPTPVQPAVVKPPQPPTGMTELPPPDRAEAFVREHMSKLLGASVLKRNLRIDDFVHRVVATVDGLARSLAPPRLWPIHTTPGRFTIEAAGNEHVISPKNAERYAPFVAMVESVNAQRAVALYRLLYPLFQRTYHALGFPGKNFQDRLIEVIDLLLATPDPKGPLQVELPNIQGPMKPTRPWLLYRFSDPEFEQLASGQKILLRVGPANEKRLKTKLAEFRKLLTAKPTNP